MTSTHDLAIRLLDQDFRRWAWIMRPACHTWVDLLELAGSELDDGTRGILLGCQMLQIVWLVDSPEPIVEDPGPAYLREAILKHVGALRGADLARAAIALGIKLENS